MLGRENPHANDPDDLDWLRASLSINAGPFSGTIALDITISELVVLCDQLEATLLSLAGHLHFATIEGNWSLDIAFETAGAAIITGSVTANPAIGNTLNYEFRSDPYSLEAAAKEIRRTSEAYTTKQPWTKVAETI